MLRERLGLKIPLLLAVVTLLVLTAVQGVVVYQDAMNQRDLVDRYVRAMAKTTAAASVSPLLVRDYPQLNTNCLGLLEAPDVLQVQIKRQDGVLVSQVAANGSIKASDLWWVSVPIQIQAQELEAELPVVGELLVGMDQNLIRRQVMVSIKQGVIQELILVAVLVAALTCLIRRSVVVPIRRVALFAQKIAAGELSEPLPQTRTDEIGQLENEIETMRQSIGGLLEQSDLLREQAHTSNMAKSQFLANMSHEIRTPMAAVLGFVEELELEFKSQSQVFHDAKDTQASEGETGEIDQEEPKQVVASHLQAIRRNGEHLLGVINDILDISKIEAGHGLVHREWTELTGLLNQVYTMLEPVARKKQIHLDFVCSEPLPVHIHIDPQRLRQILVNLIGNALKFTMQGSVTVRSYCQKTPETESKWAIVFVVLDTGVGMTPDDQKRLFKPFQQVDSSMTRKFGGTGLGLVLSRHLANELGGDITVSSSVGVGSAFTLTMDPGDLDPIAFAQVNVKDNTYQIQVIENEAIKPKQSVTGDHWPSDSMDLLPAPDGGCAQPDLADQTASTQPGSAQSPAQLQTQSQPPSQAQDLSGLRILVAEDGVDNQRLVKMILTRAKAEVVIVENGKLALDHVLKDPSQVDLILMDMQMPVMDGYTAASELREYGFNKPIIALTAHAMPEDRQRCLDAGCDDFSIKPINRPKLIELILHWACKEAGVSQSGGIEHPKAA